QPQMKEIQEKYKNDRQRLSQEMMKFYQENKINPLASCIPLLAQMPIFITLFYTLRGPLREDICGQTDMACGEIPVDVIAESSSATEAGTALEAAGSLDSGQISNITENFASIKAALPQGASDFGESFLMISDLTGKE